MKFEPGKSGNPKGRPKGIVDARRKLREQLESGGEEVVAAMLDKAVKGDIRAGKAILDKLVSNAKPKSRAVSFDPLPASASIEDRARQINNAVFAGDLDTELAQGLLANLLAESRINAQTQLSERITEIEKTVESFLEGDFQKLFGTKRN